MSQYSVVENYNLNSEIRVKMWTFNMLKIQTLRLTFCSFIQYSIFTMYLFIFRISPFNPKPHEKNVFVRIEV